MEKSNKVMNIIVNCVAFVVIVLFLVGMFALPPIRVSAAGASESSSVYSIIGQMIDAIKDIAGKEGGALGAAIGKMIKLLAFVVMFAVFAIMGVIKSIILLIKSIKAISKPEENKPAIKQMVSFGVISLVWCTLVLGVFYEKRDLGLASITTSLGAGGVMILIGGLLALCSAGAYVFMSRKELPLINRILDMVTSAFAIVALMLMLFAPVGSEYGKAGLIDVLANRFGETIGVAAAGGAPSYLSAIMTVVGSALVFVALGFAKMVIFNGYRLLEDEKKGLDYPKSSIVKSSLWLGFVVAGVILCFAFTDGLGIGIGGIMTFVFVALALGCAIANKVMSPKAEKSAEAKAE